MISVTNTHHAVHAEHLLF